MKLDEVERGADYFRDTTVYQKVQNGTATDEERWELAEAVACHQGRLDIPPEVEAEMPTVRGLMEERLDREVEIMRRDRVIPKWLQPDGCYRPAVEAEILRLATLPGGDLSAG